MQVVNEYNISERTLFYWGKLYCSQIHHGEAYSELKKTITINILDFDYFEYDYHSVFHLREDTYNESILKNIEIHFIELPKFRKLTRSYDNTLRNWLLFIDGSSKEELDMAKKKDPIIKEAEEACNYIMSEPEAQRLYELREKWALDERSNLYSAKKEGKIEVAKKMLAKGINITEICEITGLDKKDFAN